MANNPKKAKDPTEVALSAIQEALNIEGSISDTRGSGRTDAAPEISTSAPVFDEPSFDTRPSNDRSAFGPIEEPRPARRAAAHDDRESIGQALQALQRGRAGNSARTLAVVASAIWI